MNQDILDYFIRKVGIKYLPNKYFKQLENLYMYASLECINNILLEDDENKIILYYLINPKQDREFLCDISYVILRCRVIDNNVKFQMQEYINTEIEKLN